MQYFGIKDTDTPAYAIHDAASNSKYLLANASPEDLTSFVAEFEVRYSRDNATQPCFTLRLQASSYVLSGTPKVQ